MKLTKFSTQVISLAHVSINRRLSRLAIAHNRPIGKLYRTQRLTIMILITKLCVTMVLVLVVVISITRGTVSLVLILIWFWYWNQS